VPAPLAHARRCHRAPLLDGSLAKSYDRLRARRISFAALIRKNEYATIARHAISVESHHPRLAAAAADMHGDASE
jgi:hypothetical protein